MLIVLHIAFMCGIIYLKGGIYMKFKVVLEKLSAFVRRTLYCFALIALGMTIVGSLAKTDDTMHYLASEQMMTFFVFSLLFAFSFFIADFITNNVIIKRSVQFILSYGSLVAVFLFGGTFQNYVEQNSVQNPAFSVLSISFMFVVIYAAAALLVLIGSFIKSRIENSDKEYKSIFDKKN